jgi:hypothetical protein
LRLQSEEQRPTNRSIPLYHNFATDPSSSTTRDSAAWRAPLTRRPQVCSPLILPDIQFCCLLESLGRLSAYQQQLARHMAVAAGIRAP